MWAATGGRNRKVKKSKYAQKWPDFDILIFWFPPYGLVQVFNLYSYCVSEAQDNAGKREKNCKVKN